MKKKDISIDDDTLQKIRKAYENKTALEWVWTVGWGTALSTVLLGLMLSLFAIGVWLIKWSVSIVL